jgi:hypothetical protein
VALYENLTTFQGKKVEDFDPEQPLGDPRTVAYRIRLDWDEGEAGTRWVDKFAQLLEKPDSRKIESFIAGAWEEVSAGTDSTSIVESLAAARDGLPRLKHLFFGDITMEESEISWITQTDVSPIFEAHRELEHITIRGGTGLSLGHIRHERLRELIIQTGGLPPQVIHDVSASELPALEHLELWLGEPNYGGNATVEDLATLLRGDRFPKLKYLGIKDSVIADEVAGVLANSPILRQLDVLDVSLGQLGDDGAKALLASPEIRSLKKLDVHHHFISDELVAKLKSLGIEVDASEKQKPSEWRGEEHRFIAVSE